MEDKNVKMVPIITSQAGNCLTYANWQDVGANIASFYLTELLMKPGFDFLMRLPNLATYMGWHGTLVLNASNLHIDASGSYTLRSHYDGSYLRYSAAELLKLIAVLQPNIVLLPKGMSFRSQKEWKMSSKNIELFVDMSELEEYSCVFSSCGVYFSYHNTLSQPSELLQQLASCKHLPCYIMGELTLPLMRNLVKNGVRYVESDVPARDAYIGNVYTESSVITLPNDGCKTEFVEIDKNCKCPTCSQKLTKAYLHHLLEQTPLLCQRYLIQHNIYYCQQFFCK